MNISGACEAAGGASGWRMDRRASRDGRAPGACEAAGGRERMDRGRSSAGRWPGRSTARHVRDLGGLLAGLARRWRPSGGRPARAAGGRASFWRVGEDLPTHLTCNY